MTERLRAELEARASFVRECRLEAERLHEAAELMEGRGDRERASQARKNAAVTLDMGFRELHQN